MVEIIGTVKQIKATVLHAANVFKKNTKKPPIVPRMFA